MLSRALSFENGKECELVARNTDVLFPNRRFFIISVSGYVVSCIYMPYMVCGDAVRAGLDTRVGWTRCTEIAVFFFFLLPSCVAKVQATRTNLLRTRSYS